MGYWKFHLWAYLISMWIVWILSVVCGIGALFSPVWFSIGFWGTQVVLHFSSIRQWFTRRKTNE